MSASSGGAAHSAATAGVRNSASRAAPPAGPSRGHAPCTGPAPRMRPAVRARALTCGRPTPPRRAGRQAASLGVLTRRFLDVLRHQPSQKVDLNEVAQTLGVPKRRIYDITNVLEGIGMLDKLPKGCILWRFAPLCQGLYTLVGTSAPDAPPLRQGQRRQRGRSAAARHCANAGRGDRAGGGGDGQWRLQARVSDAPCQCGAPSGGEKEEVEEVEDVSCVLLYRSLTLPPLPTANRRVFSPRARGHAEPDAAAGGAEEPVSYRAGFGGGAGPVRCVLPL